MTVELIVYRLDWDNDGKADEIARITLDGDVTGDTPTARHLADRYQELQTRLNDEREVLRYLEGSYTNGYIAAGYNSEEAVHIIHEMTDDEYADWKSKQDFEGV